MRIEVLITCSHVCIIRGKPITASNACQAVKCYPAVPARWTNDLLGHLLDISPLSAVLSSCLSSSLPFKTAQGRIIIALIVTTLRDTTSSPLPHAMPHHAMQCPYHATPCREMPHCYTYHHYSRACQYHLITVIICGNGKRCCTRAFGRGYEIITALYNSDIIHTRSVGNLDFVGN